MRRKSKEKRKTDFVNKIPKDVSNEKDIDRQESNEAMAKNKFKSQTK